MAQNDISNSFGWVDDRVGRGYTGITHTVSNPAGHLSVGSLRAYLTAYNATSYSPARLDAMTKNDMTYALRMAYDASSF